ncbi:peptide/nickel transport system ATP-binding protein [Gemmobacter megaterium]|uniref:Peptide/nickel transport system ATP-binding protein n=1 Tax=Gemmobacter megaterium TaxID=1086013 RepID=A0A1N7LRB8_9RHOB|nr:oligopeptide/dipeptide ABC transporter ATP-binding protein [Gemmobacter megaterium]GGE10948.1 ABC transporter ATP-binding protein [Gemmobacter megaterium]SIS76387.1 peptide/nickel transport system ATP-binding protein [Gemmobacter megaterium]
MSAADQPVLDLRGVSKRFGEQKRSVAVRLGLIPQKPVVHALDGVDLTIAPGEVVGLVGESGSGKSTLGRIAAGLMTPSDGTVRVYGRDAARDKAVHRDVQMIFQDPQASLNPRLRVDQAVGEAPLVHGMTDKAGFDSYVSAQLARVGLDPAVRSRFPHQFSGGQRQRINIARALALAPRFLVCDESIAALDVSIQAQILNLFMDLRDELNLTYLFISHDLRAVQHICDRVVIMYLGRIVEDIPALQFSGAANHPYTRALLGELPDLNQRRKTWVTIKGEIPSPIDPPKGCHFHPRCPHAFDRCRVERPALAQIGAGHRSACHLNDINDQSTRQQGSL